MKVIGIGTHGCLKELKFWQALKQHFQRNLHFQSCQGRADAKVNACTKGDIALIGPIWPELLAVFKTNRAAIRGPQQQANGLTFWQHQRLTQRDIFMGNPREHM